MAFPRSLSSKLVLVLLVAVLPASAVAQPASAAPTTFEDRIQRELRATGGLTADDVAARAAATSWSLDARRAELRAATANAERAGSAYLPRVTLTARYTRLSEMDSGSAGSVVAAPGVDSGAVPPGSPLVSVPLSFESLLDQYLLQASVVVPVSDYFLRVAPSRRGSLLNERAAERSIAATERDVAAQAKALYYGWVRARLNVVAAEDGVLQARAHRADIEQALAAGTASQADLLQTDARVAERERLLENQRHLAARLEQELRVARRDPDGIRYTIGENVQEDVAAGARESLPALVDYALTHRPELEALALRARAAGATADAERAGYLPKLDLFGNAQYENPSSRVFPQRDEFRGSWSAGVQLGWIVSDIPGAASAARSAEATSAALRAEHKALEDRIKNQVSAAVQELNDARSAIRTSARGLAAAEESFRVRRLLYQNGRATTVELLAAELALTTARLQAISAWLDLRVARVALDHAVGRPPSRAQAG